MKLPLFLFISLIVILTACKDGIVMQPVNDFPKETIEVPNEVQVEEETFKAVIKKALRVPYALPLLLGFIALGITSWLMKWIYRLTTTSP